MKKLLSIYKPIGMTPLQLIQQLKKAKPEYAAETIGYAGRLDPLAHGVMLLMIGKETKNRADYLSLPKTYTFTVLFGVETDTYDGLGILRKMKPKHIPPNASSIVNIFVNNKIGKQIQSYPPFSSKTVQGKPLFQWAKEDRLSEIEIPTHEITLNAFKIHSFGSITKAVLEKLIFTNISRIQGDFRQEEIKNRWQALFRQNARQVFDTAEFEMSCSSGTYVRQLVHEVGEELGCGAITLDILRTQIGNYRLDKALHLMV